MPTHLKVTLIQTDLAWHDAKANRQAFDVLLAPLAGNSDVIVLPEMFTSGFSMQPEVCAEQAAGPTIDWLRNWAKRLNAALVGSVATKASDCFYNRLHWVQPDGIEYSYDKRHVFRMAGEHEHYQPGNNKLIVQWRDWRICPLICYDLRFPVWSRRTTQHDYDALIYVANWPARRRYAWQALLRARAIENLSYCVGVNRIGTDANGLEYSGDSVALDYLGHPMCDETSIAFVKTIVFNRDALDEHRQKFPAHLDADEFELRL
jgi:omega-amidase